MKWVKRLICHKVKDNNEAGAPAETPRPNETPESRIAEMVDHSSAEDWTRCIDAYVHKTVPLRLWIGSPSRSTEATIGSLS